MNPAVPLACSHHIPDPVSAHLKKRGAADRHHSKTDVVHHLDESWIKCPFYVLSQGRTPLFGTDGEHGGLPVFFNGKLEFVIPEEYRPAVYSGAKALGPAKMGLEFSSKAGRQLRLLLILAKSFRMFVVNGNIFLQYFPCVILSTVRGESQSFARPTFQLLLPSDEVPFP
ncbi:uncharacterized protein EI90DRAFT_481916 [Cantharellus anzutake]|uniref:uncharacterized protein n=1 Tax=Cantharellus anzutake TaxID=1750568 RepID=UPI001907225A|nr:uncharacterized protein EI90DRAFT_481916 [Cantharellus anzutake]KAF8313913.1 hypothetical protein EI90DRAFT_481916 [Cantharellus anzutake]